MQMLQVLFLPFKSESPVGHNFLRHYPLKKARLIMSLVSGSLVVVRAQCGTLEVIFNMKGYKGHDQNITAVQEGKI